MLRGGSLLAGTRIAVLFAIPLAFLVVRRVRGRGRLAADHRPAPPHRTDATSRQAPAVAEQAAAPAAAEQAAAPRAAAPRDASADSSPSCRRVIAQPRRGRNARSQLIQENRSRRELAQEPAASGLAHSMYFEPAADPARAARMYGKLGGGSKSSSREGSFRARNRATAATPPSPAVSEPVGGRENDEGGSFGRVSPKSQLRWATGTPNSATPGSTPGSTTPSRYGSVNAEGWSVLERASRQAASRQPP